MAVKVYKPAISVRLIKLVARNGEGIATRYSEARREFDLTPYLSENGGIKLVKGLIDPAGAFQISLNDDVDQAIRDTLYARIEPMDAIEIRGAREPHLYAGRQLPLLMRGHVSKVGRTESFAGADGAPNRQVIIIGQDSGKLWTIFRLFPESIYADPSQNHYLETFRLQAATGLEIAFQPVSQMVRDLTDRVVNRNLRDMSAYAGRLLKPFTVRATVPQGIVSLNMLAPFQGSYWELLERVADRPWNEVFIEDEEAGPVVVFRPAPYRTLQRNYIMRGATDPGTIDIEDRDVDSLETWRSDHRVANFFYVPPGASLLDSNTFVSVAEVASGEPFDRDHGNNKPELYGLRKLTAESRLLPETTGALPSQLPEGERQQANTGIVQWHIQRARDLKAMNRDNSVLEEGAATVTGHERLKPGRYIRMRRGGLQHEFYCTRVVHSISPLDTWSSQLTLERGTGFVDRLRLAGSPYWMEGRKGVYER